MAYEVVVFCSGGGGNLKKILEEECVNAYNVTAVLTDRTCGAEGVAQAFGKELVRVQIEPRFSFASRLLQVIPSTTRLIVLAGYMPILPKGFIDLSPCPIINTHPSLLPKYGGKGMYGVRVHRAVIEGKETETGCTVHIVTEEVDGGPILAQTKIPVGSAENAWALGGKVFELEGPLLVEVINSLASQVVSDA